MTATKSPTGNLVDQSFHPAAKPPEERRYHIGIYEKDPPAWFATVGGQCFPVRTSKFDEAGNEMQQKGDVLPLTLEQIDRIREDVKRRVVRWMVSRDSGKKLSAEIWDVTTRGFRPDTKDEPLAKYLYLELAPEEFVQPAVDKTLLDDLAAATKGPEASEDAAQADPVDKQRRAKHGELRAQGSRLPSNDGAEV